VAQRRSSRPPDDQHPLGHGREAYFWALIAALSVFVIAAAFSLREAIDELIHPSATSSFAVAYVVLGVSTVLDLVSFRQSAGQMIRRARHYHRDFLEEARVTSDPSLRAVLAEDAVSVSGDVIAFAALALNQLTGSSVPQAAVRGIESGLKHEAKEVYRVDVVPTGQLQRLPGFRPHLSRPAATPEGSFQHTVGYVWKTNIALDNPRSVPNSSRALGGSSGTRRR
jgi:hypothetical protein